ncbi:MAG TPA: serine hydrolase domain-containing protein [Cryomorphaceae bacterium]|nr:serine hydrolase domain-containing protein [Cryomorphaceae bacterium]
MTKSRKKRIIQVALLVGTVISLFYVPWILVWAWIQPLPDTVQEQIDDTIGYGFDGMVVYVDKGGEAPAFYAGGWKDKNQKIPADAHSLFKIASISKLYVAVAVAKLVNDGRLSLDNSLASYLPELAGRIENAKSITVKMMVQHRSGIPNFTDHPGYWVNPPNTTEGALELVLDLPADFEPNTSYAYSNTNYLLLRRIVEKTAGYDHFEFIKKEILNPLDLHNTYGSLNEVDINDVMSGYYVGYEPDLKTEDTGMLATAEDVGKFLKALNDGSLFDEGEQEIYSSIYVYNHTGLVPGYQSIAEYHKDIDAVVVQFTSTTDFEGYNWSLSEIAYNRIVKIVSK